MVDDPILALGMTVNFSPWDRFFDFPYRSYSSFRKKKLVDPSLWGHRLPVTALALSARRPFGPAHFARGLDKNSSSPSGDDERASGVGNLVVETLQGGGGAERDSHLEDKEIIIRRGIEGQPPGEDREIMMMIRR